MACQKEEREEHRCVPCLLFFINCISWRWAQSFPQEQVTLQSKSDSCILHPPWISAVPPTSAFSLYLCCTNGSNGNTKYSFHWTVGCTSDGYFPWKFYSTGNVLNKLQTASIDWRFTDYCFLWPKGKIDQGFWWTLLQTAYCRLNVSWSDILHFIATHTITWPLMSHTVLFYSF